MKTIVPYVSVVQVPGAEPFTVTQAAEWCRIDDVSGQEMVLMLCIRAARERAEEITGRALTRRSLELRLDEFPEADGAIELPYPPVASIDYVRYIDPTGATITLAGSPTAWTEDLAGEPCRIMPLLAQSWPSAAPTLGAVRVGYTCGYAPSSDSPTDFGANIPANIRLWMHARIATFYEQREQLVLTSNVNELPRDYIDGLLDGQRVRLGLA